MNKNRYITGLAGILLLLAITGNIQAQSENKDARPPAAVLKTNLLYDATTTLNLGVEARLGDNFTLDMPFNYNPWNSIFGGKMLKHWLFQPELRYWTRESFHKSFFGLHAHGAQYNTMGVFDDNRLQGWLAGAGISYGYRWNFGNNYRWGLEATIGAGYAYLDYTKYSPDKDCGACGEKLGTEAKHYFGPTKAALSITYTLGKTAHKAVAAAMQPSPPPAPIIIVPVVADCDTVFIPVPAAERQILFAEGEAYINFPLNSYEFLPLFGNNHAELDSIRALIENIRSLPNVEIEKFEIEAFASPEGTLLRNIELSVRRAEALRDHIAATYGIDKNCFTVRYGGENWNGLRAAIEKNSVLTTGEKNEIYRILDIQDVATRKNMMKQHPKYDYLLREVYPPLRISKYRVGYSIMNYEL
jgi:outer membrane protein OmpA-like peptidoglycan-associated protein